MQSRNGAIAVAAVEYLVDAAPLYNVEDAGEHDYEITDLALLVHNADWGCRKFLAAEPTMPCSVQEEPNTLSPSQPTAVL